MKPRILTYRFTASHDWITSLGSIHHELSISDYDAFVFDPLNLETLTPDTFARRDLELHDLVHKKGGIVVCTLRTQATVSVGGYGDVGRYGMLRSINRQIADSVGSLVRAGEGFLVKPLNSAHGPTAGYFQVLKGSVHYAAYLQTDEAQIVSNSGRVFA